MIAYKGVDFAKILRRYDVEAQNEDTPESIAKKMLPADPVLKKVAETVLYMKLKEVGPTTAEALKTHKPLDIINNGLVVGMECVAKLYAAHIYYLPEIMMAAKTMEIGIALAEKQIAGGRQTKGLVVMHAAEGDPHDIGKNIAAVMLRSSGYSVIDMGKDVAVTDVVAKVEEVKPMLVTGTALMTTTMTAFPRAAEILVKDGYKMPFMAAGGAVNRDFAESFELGIYSEKAPQTPPIADKIVEGYDWKRIREEWDEITGA
ncbi:MAG: cobalamin-dependent protein [Candidatus Methanomethylophilaceae archaeon]|jgi:methanol corrinoid protein|nr:cobalamin-dependent protein [Candidatus Methanomethylophilaceae archaeon]MBR3410423.1 cobalamin-dependent protein [Candidatus Methanomethylophilaceae archaeon]MBR3476182.1 cobalamin-dependent protein [Candidatus Methanomethylophilaceae archaeon]MBR6870393.1 cobalamin-dependent protein [Candidatus Methanomethylophilaceae archaeon]